MDIPIISTENSAGIPFSKQLLKRENRMSENKFYNIKNWKKLFSLYNLWNSKTHWPAISNNEMESFT